MDYKKWLVLNIQSCVNYLSVQELESIYKQHYALSQPDLIAVNIKGVFVLVPRDSYDWQIIDDRLSYSTPRYNADGVPLASFYPSHTAKACWDKKFHETLKHLQKQE